MFNPLAELPKFWCKMSCTNFLMNNRIKSIGLYLLVSCTLYYVHLNWVYSSWNYCHQGQRWEKRVLKGWQQAAAEMEGSGQLVLLRLHTQPFCCGTANKGSLFQTPSSCRSLLELMINQVSTCTLKIKLSSWLFDQIFFHLLMPSWNFYISREIIKIYIHLDLALVLTRNLPPSEIWSKIISYTHI